MSELGFADLTAAPVFALVVREPEAVYRPRHPERTALYRLFERHFDQYARCHEERFERRAGSLRPVVPRTVGAYLDCGRLFGGFARLRCPKCKGEHLLAFSCQTRNFCQSCQAKRAALFAEKLQDEILAPVPHRHVVFTACGGRPDRLQEEAIELGCDRRPNEAPRGASLGSRAVGSCGLAASKALRGLFERERKRVRLQAGSP